MAESSPTLRQRFPSTTEWGVLSRLRSHFADTDSIAGPLPSPETVVSNFKKNDRQKRLAFVEARDLSNESMIKIASDALSEMGRLETAALDLDRWKNLTKEEAKKIKNIVVFSAPGLYFASVKSDRYEDLDWAWGMDRIRADHAVRLGIHLAGLVTGEDFSVFDSREPINGDDPELSPLRDKVRASLLASGIRFTYVSRPDEGDAVREVLADKKSFVPPEIVDIIDDSYINNTIDQVQAVGQHLDSQLYIGDGVVFVAHGPQLVRMAGKLARYDSIPEGVHAFFEPLAIPPGGSPEYPLMETKGRLAYVMTNDSLPDSCDYTILGAGRQPDSRKNKATAEEK